MSDNAAESMNFKVSAISQPGRESRDFRMITLEKVYAWIDKKDYDESVKLELKKMVANYPNNAYVQFGKNFQKHLVRAQNLARKTRPLFVGELGDDNYKKLESLNQDFVKPDKEKTTTVTKVLTKVYEDEEIQKMRDDFEDEIVSDDLKAKEKIVENENISQNIQPNTSTEKPLQPSTPYGLKQISLQDDNLDS